jgi:serine/threonine protein kinase
MRCVTSLAASALPLDERTLLCTAPDGASPPAARPTTSVHALHDGTTLGGFRIVRPLGEGGFGIVYLAWDAALERHVAIKEYMPYALATREGATLDVTLRTERDRPVFDAGLKSFVNEARLLARFDHPALVKVFSFWEANRTAYMAMPYYEGPTLKAALGGAARPASEQQLRDWLQPLLEALTVLHAEQCYHRDISPDNILLTAGGPLLLDFGAARRVISDRTQALTAMLKPGFAPIEQYGGTMLQGAWTDLYALAGVVRYAITGRPPVASVARIVEDAQRPLAQTHAGRYSDGFLQAIDAALAVRPEHRPQDVAAFRALLAVGQARQDDGFPRTQRVVRPDVAPDFPRTERIAPPRTPTVLATAAAPQPPPVRAVSQSAPIEAEPTAFGALSDDDDPRFYATTQRAPLTVAARRRRLAPLLGTVALAGLAAATWWAWPAPEKPAAPMVGASVSAPTPTPPPTPTPAIAAAATALVPKPAATPVSIAPPQTATAASPPVPSAVVKAAPAPRATPTRTAALATPKPQSEQEVTSSYTQAARPPKCGELVLKASLETLNPDEMAFLKSRCR